MPKYTQMYNQMVKEHQQMFDEFRQIHDLFKQDRAKYSQEFNEKGKPVMEVLRDYEQRLCGSMERGKFALFSDKVAAKFWERVKKDFSHIELVGVEIVKS